MHDENQIDLVTTPATDVDDVAGSDQVDRLGHQLIESKKTLATRNAELASATRAYEKAVANQGSAQKAVDFADKKFHEALKARES